MENRGKFLLLSSLLATSFMACGTVSSPKTSGQKITSSIATKSPAVEAAKKSNVLIIGGKSEPFSTIVGNLSAFSSDDKKKNLSAIWSMISDELKEDFEKENFFTVINKIDPKTKKIALSNYFGLDTSLTSMSKKEGKLSIGEMDHDDISASYDLVVGNKAIAMNWNKSERRFLPTDRASIAPANLGVQLQRDGKSVIQTSLPLFSISEAGMDKLTNLTLNLNAENFAEAIEIEPKTSDQQPNCFIISAWKDNGVDNVVMFTNFVDLQNNEINFSNFEADKLKKLEGIELNETTATTLMCANLQPKSDEKPYNTFVISAIPITIKIVKSEDAKHESAPATVVNAQPTVLATPTLPTPAIPTTPSIPVVVKETVQPAATTTPVVKQTRREKRRNKAAPAAVTVNATPAPSTPTTNSTPKTTVDGYKLQINPIGNMSFPQASAN
jgi:hypothetical protein